MKPLLIAIGASLGNALFIYSQRASPEAPNPFLFSAGTVLFAAVFCGLASFWTKSDSDTQYLLSAWPYMMLGGLGVFITFVGFFFTPYWIWRFTVFARSRFINFYGINIRWCHHFQRAIQLGAVGGDNPCSRCDYFVLNW